MMNETPLHTFDPDSINLDNHPCFNKSICHEVGRIHLPVAPKCNVQCNYCNRKYDCVNESRPGVTSSTLSPGQALAYVEKVMEKRGDIAVVGIAGPGDPMANPEETLKTFELIRGRFPKMILCLSTNGLGLTRESVSRLAELKVSHITVTINAVDPKIAAEVYAWVRHDKRVFRGEAGGSLMIERQFEALKWIKEAGMIAKVNSIVIPGVNDHHIHEVAKRASEIEADIMNCIPLIPTEDTAFEDLPEPDSKMRFRVRMQCGEHMNQMTHCARCRADAVGKLSEGFTEEAQELLRSCASLPINPHEERPYVAVATREGMLVNQHLGEARYLSIFGPDPEDNEEYICIERRETPSPGGQTDRWLDVGNMLKDCRAILVNAAGPSPKRVLKKCGVEIIEMEGMIDAGLDHVFRKESLPPNLQREFNECGKGVTCGGDGMGCG
jgi:nitrogen fixation protein NifB